MNEIIAQNDAEKKGGGRTKLHEVAELFRIDLWTNGRSSEKTPRLWPVLHGVSDRA